MTLKSFNYKGNWFQRALVYFKFKCQGYYIANNTAEVPYFRQLNKKGKSYELDNGTKCYISELDVIVELHGDRWIAIGESLNAKSLNKEVDSYVSLAEHKSEAEQLLEIQQFINRGNQSISDQIIQKELDKLGIVLEPRKDFNN